MRQAQQKACVVGAGVLALVWSAAAGAQQPVLQNGRVESRPGTNIEREIAAAGARADFTWIGWRVPMVDGERNLCSSWSNDEHYVRGVMLEPTATPAAERPVFAAPQGPVRLDAGTALLVLARAGNGHVERLRVVSDDCPLDGGGGTLTWLPDVTPADSLRFLDSLIRSNVGPSSGDIARRVAGSAVTAVGLHRDAGADPILDRLATSSDEGSVRRQAIMSLASARGAPGFGMLRTLLERERASDTRRTLVTAIGQTHETETAAVLLSLARTEPDPKTRAEAGYWYVQRAGAAGTREARAMLTSDTDATVKRRIVAGLATLPTGTAVPLLIDLAQTSADLVVKKEAVAALGRSKDERATAYLQEIIAR